MSRLDNKDVSEKIVLTFDFEGRLAADETLIGPIVVTVTTVRGNDAAPAGILNGAAEYDSTSKMVLQGVQGGADGAEYRIKVVVATTNPKKVLALAGVLPVIS